MTNLRRLRRILPILLSLCAGLSWADDYPRTPGLDVLHYTCRLELSDTTDEITVVVRFVSEGGTDFHLDLIGKKETTGMTVSAISEDGEPATFTHEDDRIHISPLSLGKGGERRSYTIRYRGVPADGLVIANNKHGERTFSADNWPNKTHHWLPTLDHPHDKATCEFVITAPDHYQVVANGLKLEETNLAADRRRTHWKQSVPIATWLMVVSVARYAVQYVDDYQATSIQTWVFPPDRDAGFYDFARAKRPLAFFSSYIGPYSYEKLANVQVTAPVGATEAATSIFYQQDFVTGDRERENTITHEIAHHWFGNAVTEDDWDHVWLSEGFATYFTLLFIEYAYGRDRFVEALKRSRERVFEFYKDNPDYHIVHDHLTDMSKVTTRNTYQKGAWFLHMLRGLMGDESFRAGIREYYRRFRDRNASTQDFRHVIGKSKIEDLDLALFGELDVPGLEVAVDDFLFVCGFHRFRDLNRERESVLDGDRPTIDPLRERFPVDELHRQELDPIRRFQTIEGRDARVIQRSENLRFSHESLQPVSVLGESVRKDFDRHIPPELRILRPEHLTHAALANGFDDFVMRESLTTRERHDRPPRVKRSWPDGLACVNEARAVENACRPAFGRTHR